MAHLGRIVLTSSLLLALAACGDDGGGVDAAAGQSDAIVAVADGAVLDGAVLDGAVPDSAVPDSAIPDGAVPDGAVPDGAIPDGAVPDGAVPDGAVPDDALPDAGLNDVTVIVYSGGVPAVGVAVQYHGVDGAYLGSAITNSAGTVIISGFPAGGAVTAPVSGTTRAEVNSLTTIANISLGDTIVIGKSPASVELGTVAATLPGTTAGAGDDFFIQPGCQNISSTNPSAVINASIYESCYPTAPSTMNILAYTGTNSLSNNMTGYSFALGVAITGTSPNLMGSATIPDWSTDFAQHRVNMNNTPANVSIQGQVGTLRAGVFYHHQRHTSFGTGADVSDRSQNLKYANGFFDEVVPGFRVLYQGGVSSSQATVFVRGSNVATNAVAVTTDFDVSAAVYPSISDFNVGGDPMQLNWTAPTWACLDNPGAPDAAIISVSGSLGGGTFFGKGQGHSWTVLTKGDVSSGFTLPSLDPATSATLWPTATFTDVFANILFFADSHRDWDAIRLSEHNLDSNNYPNATGTRCTLAIN